MKIEIPKGYSIISLPPQSLIDANSGEYMVSNHKIMDKQYRDLAGEVNFLLITNKNSITRMPLRLEISKAGTALYSNDSYSIESLDKKIVLHTQRKK